jgi:hypothetical protein
MAEASSRSAESSIVVEGFDELRQALEKAPEIALPLAQRAIDDSLRAIYAEGEAYPDETIANSPANPKGRWYERHWGTRWMRKRQMRAQGFDLSPQALGLNKRSHVKVMEGGGLIGGSPTSQQLQLRWKLNKAAGGSTSASSVEGSLENTATYAALVQGPLEIQGDVFKNIGWTSIDTAIDDTADVLDAAFGAACDDVLAQLTG